MSCYCNDRSQLSTCSIKTTHINTSPRIQHLHFNTFHNRLPFLLSPNSNSCIETSAWKYVKVVVGIICRLISLSKAGQHSLSAVVDHGGS